MLWSTFFHLFDSSQFHNLKLCVHLFNYLLVLSNHCSEKFSKNCNFNRIEMRFFCNVRVLYHEFKHWTEFNRKSLKAEIIDFTLILSLSPNFILRFWIKLKSFHLIDVFTNFIFSSPFSKRHWALFFLSVFFSISSEKMWKNCKKKLRTEVIRA